MLDMFDRAKKLLSLDVYEKAYPKAFFIEHYDLKCPDDQYILRMMLRTPKHGRTLFIPPELVWAEHWINRMDRIHEAWFPEHAYMYITVRCGEVKSVTDDSWHVDGFSVRVPHIPEQNIFWADSYPTEVLVGKHTIPGDFDPRRHNIHQLFQDTFLGKKVKTMQPKASYFIDPYIVHRRPLIPAGVRRKFVRLSFVPVEIEDDTCTPNPLLPTKHYGREDIRNKLVRFKFEG